MSRALAPNIKLEKKKRLAHLVSGFRLHASLEGERGGGDEVRRCADSLGCRAPPLLAAVPRGRAVRVLQLSAPCWRQHAQPQGPVGRSDSQGIGTGPEQGSAHNERLRSARGSGRAKGEVAARGRR